MEDKVNLTCPPGYIEPDFKSSRGHHFKYAVTAVSVVVIVCLAVGGTLAGIFFSRQGPPAINEYHLYFRTSGPTPQKQRVEVDSGNNLTIYNIDNKGLHVAHDYNKGLIVVKTNLGKQVVCLLNTMKKAQFGDAAKVKEFLENQGKRTFSIQQRGPTEPENMTIAVEGVPDISFLGPRLQEFCHGLPTHWLLPAHSTQHARSRRTAHGKGRKGGKGYGYQVADWYYRYYYNQQQAPGSSGSSYSTYCYYATMPRQSRTMQMYWAHLCQYYNAVGGGQSQSGYPYYYYYGYPYYG